MDQRFIIQRIIIDLIYSSRCPVNSFTDVSFTMVVYGENAFWAAGEFFSASDHWGKLEMAGRMWNGSTKKQQAYLSVFMSEMFILVMPKQCKSNTSRQEL